MFSIGSMIGRIAGLIARPFLKSRWKTVRDTGVHLYQQHEDGRRRVVRYSAGYQPVDVKWIEEGKR